MNEDYVPIDSKIFLNKVVRIEIDRPLGSKHPEADIIYKTNYGYVPGVYSGDGEELDAYLLGVNKPVKEFEGLCIAILKRTNEDDDKLIIVPNGENISDEDILQSINYVEQFYESILIRK